MDDAGFVIRGARVETASFAILVEFSKGAISFTMLAYNTIMCRVFRIAICQGRVSIFCFEEVCARCGLTLKVTTWFPRGCFREVVFEVVFSRLFVKEGSSLIY